MSEGSKFPQYVASIVASIGALVAGTALGWSSPVEEEVKEGKTLGFTVSEDEYSWIAGSLPLGATLACIPSGFINDAIGRQLTLCILPAIYIISWILIQFSIHIWMMYIGRLVLGMTCGAVCAIAPVYIGEIAQKEIRGICGSFFQLLITLGVTLVYLVGAFVKFMPLNIVCIVICVFELIAMIFMPKSPTFLIMKGDELKAQKSLMWLRGKQYDPKNELDLIKAEVNKNKESMETCFSRFSNRACIRALIITLGLMFFQQLSGINAIVFYAVTMFKQAGSTLEPRFSALIIGFIGFVTTFISGFFVDKLGRRLLLLLSVSFMAFGTFVLAFYFYFLEKNSKSVEGYGWIPLTSLCVYYIMFSFGFGPVPWIMVGELFPPDVRGPAGSMAATSNWFFAFVVSRSYVSVKNFIGAGVTFFIFTAISILGFVFVLLLVPETRGKSLPEIQEKLLNSFK